MKDASSQAVKGSGSKVQCRRVHRIAVAFFLGGLGLAWLAAITAWTLSRQLGVVGLQFTHVELDSSSSRELALLKVIGEMAGWTQPHKLSLLEDSHCAVFADEDTASMVDLQLIGVQEDSEQLTLQLEAAFGSEEGEEVQPLLKRVGNFLVKCHLHFDVNIFNSGLSFRMEHVVEKDPLEDSGEPGSAKTHLDFACKNWEIRKPSSPDFTAVAEAVYFVQFDIPHGRFEVLTRFFEEVSVTVKADLDYFVEHSPTAEVEVAVDGRVIASRSNTSTVISIPARVTWKMDAQVMVDLASGISGHIYNGERSPGGRTVHRSKFGLLSKAPRSAVARAAGPFHKLDLVTEERGLHMATSDLPRLLPPRRLEPGSSGDEGEMPQEQRDIEFKSSLFIDNSAWFVLDMGITEEEFVMFFEVRQIADDYTTRVEASVTNASDHSSASFRYHDKGGMTIDFGFAVDDRHARVDFEKNCSFTQRKTIAALIFGEVERPCETQEPVKGTIGIELDATWSDFRDMLSDWVHRNKSAASEDSQGSPQSPTGSPSLSGAPKPQVVTSRAWARWEHVRRHEQLGQDDLIDLSWVQNFSRDWKSFGSVGLEVRSGGAADFAEYVIGGLSTLGSILKTDEWMQGLLVVGQFRAVSRLEWDHSNASVLKVQGSTDVLSKCQTDAAAFAEVGRLASLDGYTFPQSMLENARCGKCRYTTSEGSEWSSPIRMEGWNVTEFGEQYWVENRLNCPDPSLPPVDYPFEVPFGWPAEEWSCCAVQQVFDQFNLTDGDSHTFRAEIPMNDEYERTDGQTSWGLFQVGSTDMTDSAMVIIGTLVDVMANWTGTPLTMPKFHDPWRQNSTIRSLLNHTVDFMGFELVLLDTLDAMGMNRFLDESYLKTSEHWEDNAMTRTIEVGVNDVKILLKKTNHTADDRFVLVQANLSGEPKFSAILNQSRDVPAQKTTVRYQHVIMDGANTTSVGAQDRDGNTAWVTAIVNSQGNDTEFQLNFSDLILTKHNGALSLHSMNNFLSVSGALRDSLVPNATNLSLDLRFSQVDLLFFHLSMKDGFTDRLVASVVETAVGEQRVFNFVHEDHLLSNTQSTGRLSTGGPSMLDSTIRLKAPATAETATILSLMLVQDNVTAEQPALAVVNMTSEETGHMLTAWFSGIQANNVTKGDLGFNILDQVLVSSKLVSGNGTLHMALNFTEGDSGLKEFFCDANEIAGGLDSLIFYKERGSEKVKLAMRLGDAPSVHNPVPRGFFGFFFSIPDVSISVNISESSEKNNLFDVNASIIGSEVSGRMYNSAQKTLMLEFLDDNGVASTTVSLFLSSLEVRRSGFPLESSWLARLRISRAGELEDETLEVVTFQRGQSPLQTSQHSVIVLTRWSDMFPRRVAQHFSLAEIALQSQMYERKASVAADFSGFTCTATQVSGDFLANAALWWTGKDAALSVRAWTGGILKLSLQVDIPRMTSTPTTLITTTGMLTETTPSDDTTVEVTTTGGSLAPSPQTKVVIQMALTMEDVTEFDQTALEASLNKELTNAGEEASFRIVSVDYTVKVEYTFAAIMDETHIRQALANIHGVDISQVSVQFKRRLQGPMSKLWPSRLLQSASAVEATILTSDSTQVSTMKDKAASPASLATELTSISGEQVPVPEVSAIPEASVEVVTEIIVNGGSVSPSLLSQTAVSQMVSRAAQDAGFAAPVRVEEPMIVTESTSTTVTTGTGDSESGSSQVTPSIASAILLLSWVA